MWTAIVAAGKWVVDKTKQGVQGLVNNATKAAENNFQKEIDQIRQSSADALAKLGVGAAAKVGPPGNVYGQAASGQLSQELILGGLALVLVLVLVMRK